MRDLQVAIHSQKGSFSDRWIEYCNENGIPYKIVNCHESDIMSQLASADVLLWHWNHVVAEDVLIARNVIHAAELMGLKVFPDSETCWSFDDKVAQKYLLEAIGAPLIPSYVFFDRQRALDWIAQASFPKVFKLRRGSGSINVRLVCGVEEARALVERAFGRGFKSVTVTSYVRDTMAKLKSKKSRKRVDLLGKVKRFPRRVVEFYWTNKYLGRENGYIYFQDFISGNLFDIRIIIIGHRYAFGFTRDVRENDFRASGSGSVDYNRNRINPKCINIAFDVAKKLRTQSIAFDFVTDSAGEPWIAEISYAYPADGAGCHCPGYWDKQLQWHEGHIWPQDAVLIDLLEQLISAKG